MSSGRSPLSGIAALAGAIAGAGADRLTVALGGRERTRVIVVLACVLGLSAADVSTVGASAIELRHGLHISNTDIGLLVATTSLVGAVASLPFGVLADRVRRTTTLGIAIVLWAVAMIWSASVSSFHDLLVARVFLGAVTAAAGPMIASLVGDYFGGWERGRIYGYILAGELLGAGFGFAVTGDIAAASWRAAFIILALPAIVLSVFVARLPEPRRGGRGVLEHEGEETPRATDGDGTPHETDAQRLARERGLEPDPELVLSGDPRRMNIVEATRYVLRIRTNIVLIFASALGYYFLAGVQTFGVEFVKEQYSVGQALANGILLVVGIGALTGVLAGGALGDRLLRRGRINGRLYTAVGAAVLTPVLFGPALFTRSVGAAIPYLLGAVFVLSAQNPPLDAARLDIMPPRLWGRAESVRTLLRSLAQALAPLVFGAVSDHVFGGGRSGLQWTFVVMLAPLAASAYLLYTGLRTYPRDVATASASASGRSPDRARPGD
ncbi:MAG TPA: MFS transporter [Gaiellaceae bacterium]|nr:MFS transporter [Gaiellaceae bacterium]